MELVLTEDQELIAKTARDFADERSPVSRLWTSTHPKSEGDSKSQ